MLIFTANLSACCSGYASGSEEEREQERVRKRESEREGQISRILLREHRNLGKIDENSYHGPRLKATEVDGIVVQREQLANAHRGQSKAQKGE